MGYFLELGSRGYEGARRGLQPSGLRPVVDPEEEKRQARIEAIYATRPGAVSRGLRGKKQGEISERMNDEHVNGDPSQYIEFNPEKDILGSGDFALTYKIKRGSDAKVLKVFLPRSGVWNRLGSDSSEKAQALEGLSEDEWEVLKMGISGVVGGRAKGSVRLTEATHLPFIVRDFHPHTISSTAGAIREHDDRIAILHRGAKQIGFTLERLYENGVLVTDLTPDNVLVDPNGNFLLGDVGGALRIGEKRENLLPGFSFGTPDSLFAPPEFAGMVLPTADDATQRSQVYSVAALLHFMAGGLPPDQMDRFLGSEYRDINKLDLPASMVEAMRIALSRDPQDRYETPGEFARALKASK